jgi:amino acid transporter
LGNPEQVQTTRQKVFVRETTGLVRAFSAWDSLAINLGTLGVWTIVIFVSSTATLTGGDPLTGFLLPFVCWFFIGLAFVIATTITPRTAGDYVFTTRYLSPAAGFVGNAGVFLAVVPIGGIGIAIVILNSFGLSPLLAYWGYSFGNSGLVTLASTLETTPIYEFVTGATLAVIFGLIPIIGGRIFRKLNRIMFPFLLLTMILTLIVLAVTPQTSALNSLSNLTGNPNLVHNLMTWGAANNNPPPSTSSFSNTLALSAVFGSAFSFMIMATYYAGEIRQVRRSTPFAIIGTLVVVAAFCVLATVLSYTAFGYGFLSNLYTQSIAQGSPPLAILPYLNFLAAAISPNIIIGTLIVIGPLIQICWLFANGVFLGSRLLFSYSMDRIAPSFLADMSDRFYVLTKAILVTIVFGLLGGLLFVLPSAGVAFLLSGASIAILYIFPIATLGVALLVYRWKRAAQFKASPVANTFLGGPLYYIAAIVTVAYSLFGFYQYVSVPALLGYAGTEGLELIIVPIVILFLLFYISKVLNKRRGIDFDLAFKDLPPE